MNTGQKNSVQHLPTFVSPVSFQKFCLVLKVTVQCFINHMFLQDCKFNMKCFQKQRQRATAERVVLRCSLPRVSLKIMMFTGLTDNIMAARYIIPWGRNNPKVT